MADAPDYWSRQLNIPQWKQEVIHEQTAFVLGAGGIGTNVAFALCRLGIKKLFILDMDVVDSHNLNRQTLYGLDTVNKPKAEAAAETLKRVHSVCTEVVPVNLNALTGWKQLVEIARQCTVLFNGIDVGDYFDVAVQSLGLALGIPVSVAGTFQSMITVDFFKGAGSPCWGCMGGLANSDVIKRLAPQHILDLDSIDFVPHDEHPQGASFVCVAVIAGQLAVNNWVNFILDLGKCPTRSILYLQTLDIDKWEMERDPECLLCSKLAPASSSVAGDQ